MLLLGGREPGVRKRAADLGWSEELKGVWGSVRAGSDKEGEAPG